MIDHADITASRLIRDYASRDDMGRLRTEVAVALREARRDVVEIQKCDKCDLCEDHHGGAS